MASAGWTHLSTVPILLAADAAAGGEGLKEFLVLFVPLFLIWYFLVIMPQQRQRKKTQEMLGNLKAGDKVLTSGGIYGTIAGFRGEIVQLQVASQVKLDVARSAVTAMQPTASEVEAAAANDSGTQAVAEQRAVSRKQ